MLLCGMQYIFTKLFLCFPKLLYFCPIITTPFLRLEKENLRL